MPSLLLELFSEEIPARMQAEASSELASRLSAALAQENLPATLEASYVTPRRLAVIVKDLPARQADATLEKKGPKTSAPQPAIDGFLKSTGLTLDKLEKRMVGKDETYFAVTHRKGQPTAVILKSIIEKILGQFPWPKSMRWGSGTATWVRPLHSILCVFDGKVVPVEFAGITAGNTTHGHRFLSPQAITIASAQDYKETLRNAFVLADAAERKAEILKQAKALTEKHSLTLKSDERLLDEVTGLVEWPTVLMGQIDAQFMDLPPEVLTSEMRAHQKYFTLTPTLPSPASGGGSRWGTLAPHFLIVSNMKTSDDGKAVTAGNERVLRARLSDGRFFFDQDRKKKLEDWGKGLAGITFHAKLGTLAQKVERMQSLATALAVSIPGADKTLAMRATELCKADLTTGMVGEFPELQGVMGRYYALHQKEDPQVADAIRDHYLPLGPDSPAPTAPLSVCVALTDKLDTLISLFAAGEKPTGSKDPFALRRSALGIIRILLENNIRLKLKAILNDELLAFFADRLAVQLKDKGIRHDVIKAVMAGGDDDLVRVSARAKALQDFLATDDGANLLAAYKRAVNILNIEEKKDKKTYSGVLSSEVKVSSIEEPLNHVIPIISACCHEERFTDAMSRLSTLRKPIDTFFENTLINDLDAKIREDNLIILARIRFCFDQIANFTLIEGK